MDQDSGFDTSVKEKNTNVTLTLRNINTNGIRVVYEAALFSVLYFYSVHALFCTVERFYNFVTK